MTTMNWRDMASEGVSMAGAVSALLPPNIGLALAIGARIINVALEASKGGEDITDEQLNQLVGEYTAARARNQTAVDEHGPDDTPVPDAEASAAKKHAPKK